MCFSKKETSSGDSIIVKTATSYIKSGAHSKRKTNFNIEKGNEKIHYMYIYLVSKHKSRYTHTPIHIGTLWHENHIKYK